MKLQGMAVVFATFALLVGGSLAAQSEKPAVANIWEQCGGKSCSSGDCPDAQWSGTQCAEGLKCLRQSEYYWQCKAIAELYQQCGGQTCAHKGTCSDGVWATCTGGNICVRKNNYYWQCMTAEAAAKAMANPEEDSQRLKGFTTSQKNMRLANLAYVPIPRHTVIHSKRDGPSVAVASVPKPAAAHKHSPAKAEEIPQAATKQVSIASTGGIRPASIEQVRPASAGPIRPAAVEQIRPASTGPIRPVSVEQTRPAATPERKEDHRVATAALGSKDIPAGKPSAHKEHPAVAVAAVPAKAHNSKEGLLEGPDRMTDARIATASVKEGKGEHKRPAHAAIAAAEPKQAKPAEMSAAAGAMADPAAAFAAEHRPMQPFAAKAEQKPFFGIRTDRPRK